MAQAARSLGDMRAARPTRHAARATGCELRRGSGFGRGGARTALNGAPTGAPPNRPISRILSRAVIYLGPALPPASCGPPGTWRAACRRPCLALLPAEVGRFTPGAYTCLFPKGCHKRRASSLCPYSCPSPDAPTSDDGRYPLPCSVECGLSSPTRGRGDRLAGPAVPAAGALSTLTMGKSEREVGVPGLGSIALWSSARQPGGPKADGCRSILNLGSSGRLTAQQFP